MNKTDFRVLIVDDVAHNIQIVAHILQDEGYQLSFSQDGRAALELLESKSFDLILLDIRMPGMDGYTVCEAIKNNPLTADIPIIFLTANADAQQIIQGLRIGAVDYITKPFEPMELRARVSNHLRLKRALDLLEEKNQELEKINGVKSELMSLVTHDLKNPLSAIISGLKSLENKLETPLLRNKVVGLSSAAWRMNQIIENFLNLEALEAGVFPCSPQNINLIDVLDKVQYGFEEWIQQKNMLLTRDVLVNPAMIYSDLLAVEQIFENILSNAIKFSPPRSEIQITLSENSDYLWINVRDQGPGISEPEQELLYQRFQRLTPQPTSGESSTGLGLSLVFKLVQMISGKLICESELGQGSHFKIGFPRQPAFAITK